MRGGLEQTCVPTISPLAVVGAEIYRLTNTAVIYTTDVRINVV